MNERKDEKAPKRERTRPGKRDRPAAASQAEAANGASSSRSLVVGAVALALGAAAGWLVRDARAKTPDTAATRDPSAAASASAGAGSGPCGDWAKAVCDGVGEVAEGCANAKTAAEVMPDAACVAARADLGATVAKLKAARSSCDTLTEKLCNDLGKETETCKMVQEKTPSFPADRCKEMLAGYDGVLAELRQMERANAPLSQELATRQASGDAPGFGPADAKVTIVEYSDFECPFCGRAAEVVEKVKEKYGQKVRFVFRQFPLGMHENAPLAAEAALAAHAQGKFWPLHDILFENQRSLDRASLEGFAEKAGLDVAKFKKALDDHTYAAAVESDKKLGDEAGVSGTPSMFIGTDRVANPTDFDALAKQLDAKLAATGN